MKKVFKRVFTVAIGAIAGAVAGSMAVGKVSSKKIRKMAQTGEKMHQFYKAFNQWLCIYQVGRNLTEYFERNHYKTVAIYGMKELGERLYDELEGTGITVSYAIDKNADLIYADVDVITPDEELKQVDVIVVTALYYFDEIKEMLCQKVNCPVISLEDILYED